MVSILIPNYNKANYLIETLDSVLAQTYTHWECIIVDDHSTDNSWEILEEYARLDQRFKVFKRPVDRKPGGNAARNFAFENSKGAYIQWLDSDDLIHKNKISEQISCLQASEENSVSVANWKWIKESSDIVKKNEFAGNISNIESRWDHYPDNGLNLILWLFKNKSFIPIHAYLISKKILEESGLWNEDLIQNQDGEFMVRVLLKCEKVSFINSVYTYYRRPDSNHLSKQTTFQSWDSWYDSYVLCDNLILEKKDDLDTRKVLIKNFEMLILSTLFDYPELAKKSWKRIKILCPKCFLNFKKPKIFILFYLFGFENTLKARKILKRFNIIRD
jgi:glycosyltransferase involved in cell wall biosynthesis